MSWNQSRTGLDDTGPAPGELVTGIAPVSRLDWNSVENKDDRLPRFGTLWKNKDLKVSSMVAWLFTVR